MGALPDNKPRAGKRKKKPKTKFTGRGCRKCQPARSVQSRPKFSLQPTALLQRERLCGARLLKTREGKGLLTALAPSHTMHPSAHPVYYGVVFAWYIYFFYASAFFVANLQKPRTVIGRFNPFWGSQWKYLSFLNVVSVLTPISPS